MAGLLDDRKKSQYLQMAEEKLQGLLNLPQQAQRFLTSPTAFLGLLGQNPLPRESGFAAGATGLPPTEMSVLDPNQAAYMQGYSQGEPVGYAGLALPLAAPAAVAGAKALGPKAGQALESYMVNQGMIQPLTAYHGTPNTIQGKFDINKVGTGEGNQSYGYGMYFAENPKVAEFYRDSLSTEILLGDKPLLKANQLVGTTKNQDLDEYLRSFDGNVVKIRDTLTKTINQFDQEGKKSLSDYYQNILNDLNKVEKKLTVKNTGNLYKVDVPDQDIPNMLDWDKPLNQQKNVQQAIQNLSARSDLPKGFDKAIERALQDKFFDGQDLYYELTKVYKDPAQLSKIMEESGFKGIRYLDEFSRKEGGTSNFVLFDPADVKILEKNSEKVEGLLD